MGASFFIKCYSLVFISLLLGFFSISEVDFKGESQPFVSLFSKSSYMCHSDSINYAFDKTISKNEYTLCQLGYENFCKRRNPVEEQESFYVVCPIYSVSQASHKLLYELHTNFKYYCHSLGVKFVQIEYAFPYQDFILTEPQNEPYDIQIPGRNIFYLRENLINVAEKKLPQDYEYIAWIDAHVHFDNPYIFQQMIVELGKSKIVAPHSIVEFKDKTNKTLQSKSYPYVYQVYYQEAKPKFDVRYNKKFDIFPFYGLAFATTKHVFRKMDGVPDICIAGNCDVYMSIALINGHVPKSHKKIYGDKIANWIKQTSKIINGEFKYIKSSITHFDHSFPLRKQSNWADAADLLAKRNFNWERDLRRDENETLYFVDNFELAYDFWKFYSSI